MDTKLINKLLSLARDIQAVFPSFVLGGGTALMFRYYHRTSTDLDFFSEKDFSFNSVLRKAQQFLNIEAFEKRSGADNLDIYIQNVKVSFILFPFKSIESFCMEKGICSFSDYDIFLNKLYACGRRVLWKDPFDFAFLWEKFHFDLAKAEKDFQEKFPGQDFNLYLKAATTIEDYPELKEMPETCKILKNIKKILQQSVRKDIDPLRAP